MICNVDLHTHSTASDGQYSPTELLEKAHKLGIECLALTDHDTVDGLEEAVQAGTKLGMLLLQGVELGAKEDRHLHILGYGINPQNLDLRLFCDKLRGGRDERKYRIISFLAEKGLELTLKEVEALAGGDIIARPHFAQAMVLRGYVATTREAFDRYLDTDEYQRIERFKADAETCIQHIRGAGGHAVLAHPYQLNYSDSKLEALLKRLKDFGLEGLECYYPRHSPQQVTQYLTLAQKYNLNVTAGSDFHGEQPRPDTVLTAVSLEIEWLFPH